MWPFLLWGSSVLARKFETAPTSEPKAMDDDVSSVCCTPGYPKHVPAWLALGRIEATKVLSYVTYV